MLDHIGIKVRDFSSSVRFYADALACLGYKIVYEENGRIAGLGVSENADLWIEQSNPITKMVHIAFQSPDRQKVDVFYQQGLIAGGRDNGPPGLRPHYHPNYYAAFLLDPDGNNIEVVCHHTIEK